MTIEESMKLRFEMRYFCITLLTLAIGIMIATTFKHTQFIRGSASDIIATMFVFFSVLSFFRIRHSILAIFTFSFALAIEIGQYFHLADQLGLARGSVLSILLGNHFSIYDIFCYGIGVYISLVLASSCIKERSTPNA